MWVPPNRPVRRRVLAGLSPRPPGRALSLVAPGIPLCRPATCGWIPVRLDANVCHTYWYVGRRGNVARIASDGRRAATAAPTSYGFLATPRRAQIVI